MKILVVEDDLPTGSVLASILEEHHYTVNVATDGRTGLEWAEAFDYDLILLDIILPKLDGISLCQRLRSRGCQYPILLLTAKDSSSDRVLGLDAGADDYVVKPFDPPELMARIRALLRRNTPATTSILHWENLTCDLAGSKITCDGEVLHLTPKEYCLLELFLLNPRQIFSKRALLDRLWDCADSPSEWTVSTHVKCLRQKLKAAGANDPIETVHGLGYRLQPPSYDIPTEAPVSEPEPPQNKERKAKAITDNIWRQYRDRFLTQAAELEHLLDALIAEPERPQIRRQAEQIAHKLAGSLGLFDRPVGSDRARNLENWLQSGELADPGQQRRAKNWIGQLYREVGRDSDRPSTAERSPVILIVDRDRVLAEQVQLEATGSGWRVEVAPDLNLVRPAIAGVSPDVILLDLGIDEPAEEGMTLLRELCDRKPPISVLVFASQDSLTERVEIARLGGCTFLHKPLSARQILEAIGTVLSQSSESFHNRILIVDDDPLTAARLSDLLRPHNIDVIALDAPQQFWETLNRCQPDLLILDLEMPGYSGSDLCRVVRQDFQWHGLPILFLSAHRDLDSINGAFAAGADDYIVKDVEEAELTGRIIHRLGRRNN
ncbi:MAG: response regulator [Limnospira sp.]